MPAARIEVDPAEAMQANAFASQTNSSAGLAAAAASTAASGASAAAPGIFAFAPASLAAKSAAFSGAHSALGIESGMIDTKNVQAVDAYVQTNEENRQSLSVIPGGAG
ncbi:hypothetical protein [Mycobacteroides abscessus]|uniref:hypothetical protein n=1 Tax=Mycobacteroides abscessus TaxID=36809 RepID=UPI001040BFB0|nr:hypothetical protein [Mycobacteroides abscessus]MDO3268008.1 hypothetical protein [Mycobacteroides abscessus subsp. abscessus]